MKIANMYLIVYQCNPCAKVCEIVSVLLVHAANNPVESSTVNMYKKKKTLIQNIFYFPTKDQTQSTKMKETLMDCDWMLQVRAL